MCVIIHKPAEKEILLADLKTAMTRNPDGWGLMWSENGRVRDIKGVKMEEFLPEYEKVKHLELGIHFRIKTHGRIDERNAHPHTILTQEQHGQDLKMMHNGVISVDTSDNHDLSDTVHFIAQFVQPMLEVDPTLYADDDFWTWIKAKTASSRLLFLDKEGKFLRTGSFNEHNGSMFSNTYWRANAPREYGDSGYYGRGYGHNSGAHRPLAHGATGGAASSTGSFGGHTRPLAITGGRGSVSSKLMTEAEYLHFLDSEKANDPAEVAAVIGKMTRGQMKDFTRQRREVVMNAIFGHRIDYFG